MYRVQNSDTFSHLTSYPSLTTWPFFSNTTLYFLGALAFFQGVLQMFSKMSSRVIFYFSKTSENKLQDTKITNQINEMQTLTYKYLIQ
jgi:hypothetical protein